MWLLIFIVLFFSRFFVFWILFKKIDPYTCNCTQELCNYTFCFRNAVTRDCSVPAALPASLAALGLEPALHLLLPPAPLVPADTSFRSSFFILSIRLNFVEFRIWDAFWERCVCPWRS